MRRQKGFTLVELVMVIVLLGIVATISTQFVSLSTRGAIDLGDRQQRALQGVVVSEQITRELREAHPLSVRVTPDTNPQCIEWIPILGATSYSSVPVDEASTDVRIAPFSGDVTGRIEDSPSSFRLAVYGYPATNFYDVGDVQASISPKLSSLEDDDSVADGKIVLQSSHRFNSGSPRKRIYAIQEPVSICESGSRLYRFESYGFHTNQLSFSELSNPALSAVEGVLAANVQESSFKVDYTPASLRRSAIVNFAFVLKAQNTEETTRVTQEVQIRNVP